MTGPPIDVNDLLAPDPGAQDTVPANIPENLTQTPSDADIAALYKATGREVPPVPSDSTVEPALDLNSLLATPDATTAQLAAAGARGEAKVALGIAQLPYALATGNAEMLGVPASSIDLIRQRDELLRETTYGLSGVSEPGEKAARLVELHHQIAAAQAAEAQRVAVAKAEKLRGRPIGGFPSEGIRATLRRVFGVQEVSGVAAPPRNLAEAAAASILALPNHMIEAIENAPSQEQQAEGIASAIGVIGLFATGVIKAAEPGAIEAGYTATQQVARGADFIAQQRVKNYNALGNTEPNVSLVRDEALPLEGEQAAIKRRLMQEESTGLTQVVTAAARQAGPSGAVVIPGVARFGIGREGIQDFSIDYHPREDGLFDALVYGKDSPLNDPTLGKEFYDHGYFTGQEVSWEGKNYTIAEISGKKKLTGAAEVLLRDASGNEAVVGTDNLRRLPATAIDLPIAAEIRFEPFTPLDAAELLTKSEGKVLTPDQAAMRPAAVADMFDTYVADILGRETKEITTVEPSSLNLPPGITPHIQVGHFGKISTAFDDPLPDATAFVYAGPDGRPIGVMEVSTFTNGGFPGTYKQLLGGVTEPVQGKLTTAVIGYMIDPRAPALLQGRAALALMEHAGKLGVSRMFAPVDEAGARIVARYINKYIGEKKTTNVSYRVGEASVDHTALFNSFKQYFEGAASSEKVTTRLGADVLMQDADGATRSNFDPLVEAFARENGFLPEEVPGLKRFLENKLASEARELYLTPLEKAMYDKVVKTMHPFEALAELPQTPLSVLASSNNMTAEWNPAGAIEVRSRDDASTLLGRFHTEEGAREFINQSGQADGPHLDGGGSRNDIPPGAVGGAAMPPPPGLPTDLTSGVPPNLPPDPLNVDWVSRGDQVATIADYYARTLTSIAEYDRSINAYDDSWGTKFSPQVRAITEALRKLATDEHPWFLKLEPAGKMLKGRTVERAKVLARWAETMSSADIAREGFFRPLNSVELNLGNLLASMHVDLSRVEQFVRKVTELEKTMSDDVLATATKDLAATMHLDRTHMQAAAILRGVRDMAVDEAYSGHIIRYADAKMLEEQGIDTSPEGFAKANNITPKELAAMNMIGDIGDQLAEEFGIPEYRRIKRWIPHFVAANERGINPELAFVAQRGVGSAKEIQFVSELARTGELSNYINDPVTAMSRYIHAGFRAKHLNPVIANAVDAFKLELDKVPKDVQPAVAANLARYLSDARGVPEASRGMVSRTVNDMLKRMGVDVSSDVSHAIVNSILATYSAKFIAFRAFQGMRDYTSVWGIGVTRFGWERAAEAHKLGFGATPEEIAMSQRTGAIPPGMSPIEIESPAAMIQGRTALESAAGAGLKLAAGYAKAVGKISEAGLKLSLQPQVYVRWHHGWYTEGRNLALKTLNDLTFGKTTNEAAYKTLDLEAYAPAFVRELSDVINVEKNVEKAAHMYGQETGKMVSVSYGRTMHPKGWATTVGRLLGQYGRYPTWLANSLVEIGSRGSLSYRVRAWGRLAAVTGITYAVLQEGLGVDAWNWYLLPGIRWAGGPVVALGNAMLSLISPSERTRAQAKNEIERQLSPVPLAASDALAGVMLLDDNQPKPSNPVESLMKIAGARIAKEPSVLDQLLGTQ